MIKWSKLLNETEWKNSFNINSNNSGGLEFSSYEIELQNRVTQNDVALRVTNSKSKNKKSYFELLTQRFNFYFSTFELLTRSWKTKNYA